MGLRRGEKKQHQLNRDEILDLRGKRVTAVSRAFPELGSSQVHQLVADWYRGKSGTGSITRILEAAGLMPAHPGTALRRGSPHRG